MNDEIDSDKTALQEIWRVIKPGGIALLTFPFGKAKIIKPFSKVYDSSQVNELARGFTIEKEEYYIQDSQDNWHKCSREEAEKVDATSERYPLCLLKLLKVTN